MLTRGRKARVAVRPEAAHSELPPLPLPCVLDVLSRLAPGERLLSSAVSRGWRAAVSQTSLWAVIDLTREAASPHTASDALLAAVVSKATGQTKSLRLCVCKGGVSIEAALAAVTANRASLRRLGLRSTPLRAVGNDWIYLRKGVVDEVLRVASNLILVQMAVQCSFQDAHMLLAGQKQYSVVHVRRLVVKCASDDEVLRLACSIRHHPLEELNIRDTPLGTPAVLGALVDAAISCGLTCLYIVNCELGPQSATHLARLLRDAPRLSTLLIEGDRMFDLALVCNAIEFDDPQNTVGACWARLVAANSPSLHTLSLEDNIANEVEADRFLGHVFAALASNTFLRKLYMHDNEISARFARDVVLPCVVQIHCCAY